MTFRSKFVSRWYLFGLAILITLSYSLFPLSSHGHFLSPDETANAAFARAFADRGTLTIVSVGVGGTDTIVHPRSFASVGVDLIPGSFLAFPTLLGAIALVTGQWSISYVTLIVFALSLVSFWQIARHFFGQGSAFISTTLYAVHPVVAYYAMRGLWHNGLLVDLVVIGLALFIAAAKRRSLVGWFAGVAVISVAVALRPSELPWVLIVAIFFALAVRPLPRLWWIPSFGIPVLTALGLFALQGWAYANPLYSGYAPTVVSADSAGATIGASFNLVRRMLFPNGFQLLEALHRLLRFGLSLVGLPVFLGLTGVGVVLSRGRKGRAWWPALAAVLTAVWLTLFYGSFEFTERFGQDEVVLGSSYLRFWLPMFMLVSLFIGPGIRLLHRVGLPRWLLSGSLALATVTSLYLTFADPMYGLIKATQSDLKNGQVQREAALPVIPENAIVYAGPSDKIFFPERKVVGYTRLSQLETAQLPLLADTGLPIFFITGNHDELTLAEKTAASFHRTFTKRLRLPGGDGLYELVPQP